MNEELSAVHHQEELHSSATCLETAMKGLMLVCNLPENPTD